MAGVVGPAGSVTGVDADADAIDRTIAIIDAEGLSQASARVGSGEATGLPAGAYDVAMLRHVLAHNGGHEQAIWTIWVPWSGREAASTSSTLRRP
jgi:hypothetical protein